MREYICHNCGYRIVEKEMFDQFNAMPMYPNVMVNNILPYMNLSLYGYRENKCPECGSYYSEQK